MYKTLSEMNTLPRILYLLFSGWSHKKLVINCANDDRWYLFIHLQTWQLIIPWEESV